MKKCWKVLAAVQSALVLGGCGAEPEGTAKAVGPEVLSWEEFRAGVFQEPGSGVFIANGDEVFPDEASLRDFHAAYVQERTQGVRRDGLAVMYRNNARAKWTPVQALNLTYCVSTAFGTRYNTVVAAMQQAAEAWEATARVDFVHASAQDSNCTSANGNVVFDVNPVNVNGAYLARAFFPDQTRSTRNVLIDNTAFTTSPPLTLTGILRHELGHALGFRHEHTRPESGTCFEDNQWQALTTYDGASVMHYPQCNGTAGWELVLTTYDRLGAANLYGSWYRNGSSDHDGDNRADLVVWRATTGNWNVRFGSGAPAATRQWGAPEDVPVPGDYDGDGKTDFAVWRPSTNQWFQVHSSTGGTTGPLWGTGSLGDRPVPGDYDGDGKTDLAVWRPSTGNWSVRFSSGAPSVTRQWGAPDDVPVQADYDGDGKTDFAVWRPSTNQWFHVYSSTGGATGPLWGTTTQGDQPTIGYLP
ncbi:MAG TPA: M57 family metalloprotease [Myxococcus sp.]|nr:M57 family metalloprotease [Myxococcus sp.]